MPRCLNVSRRRPAGDSSVWRSSARNFGFNPVEEESYHLRAGSSGSRARMNFRNRGDDEVEIISTRLRSGRKRGRDETENNDQVVMVSDSPECATERGKECRNVVESSESEDVEIVSEHIPNHPEERMRRRIQRNQPTIDENDEEICITSANIVSENLSTEVFPLPGFPFMPDLPSDTDSSSESHLVESEIVFVPSMHEQHQEMHHRVHHGGFDAFMDQRRAATSSERRPRRSNSRVRAAREIVDFVAASDQGPHGSRASRLRLQAARNRAVVATGSARRANAGPSSTQRAGTIDQVMVGWLGNGPLTLFSTQYTGGTHRFSQLEGIYPLLTSDLFNGEYESMLRLDEALEAESIRRRGANPTMISELPVYKATVKDTENSCRICLCDIQVGEDLRRLPCSHSYHPKCIDEWLKRNAICPVDNQRIDGNTSI
uniref:RING-type domain-containing protein n=1 Tax=Timspurckia oligopyrenoides TaxID=708627 RepID=A0A7S0ZG11_9RHOD|mmetsp:Transcript_3771/g.6592  ORF Transcript_3771/g.6592 Transcript_3771/m.6592 type:complete len:432 (+) Transcript_3771:77-1372(+)